MNFDHSLLLGIKMTKENSLLTTINGVAPLTLDELELIINQLVSDLDRWEGVIANQLPSNADKLEFLDIMSSFPERLEKLQNKYYELVESVDFTVDLIKSHPSVYEYDPEFKRTVEIMKNLPHVKKKWRKHKKPFP